jgi:hypothetical protein
MSEKNKKCKKYSELMNLALDGLLGGNKQRALDEHLATCGDCGREMRFLNLMAKTLAELPAAEVPAGFDSAVLASVRRARTTEQARPAVRWLRWAVCSGAAAAGIYAAAGIETLRSSLWLFVKSIPGFSGDAVAAAVPLSHTGLSLIDTLWTIFVTAVNLAGPLTEMLVFEQTILVVTLTCVLVFYFAVSRFTRAPARLPVL